MFGIGLTELLLILIACLIFIRPNKMISLGGELGRWFRQIKPHLDSVRNLGSLDTNSLLDADPDEDGQEKDTDSKDSHLTG